MLLKQYNFKNSTHILNSNSWIRLQVIARTFFLSLLDLSKRALRSSSHIITAHLELASQITKMYFIRDLQKSGGVVLVYVMSLSIYLKHIGVVEKGFEGCGEGKATRSRYEQVSIIKIFDEFIKGLEGYSHVIVLPTQLLMLS